MGDVAEHAQTLLSHARDEIGTGLGVVIARQADGAAMVYGGIVLRTASCNELSASLTRALPTAAYATALHGGRRAAGSLDKLLESESL